MLIGRGRAGDGDVRRESHRGSSQAFVSKETGKCSVMAREEVGGGELVKQVVQYIADSAATCNMTPDADGLPIPKSVTNP